MCRLRSCVKVLTGHRVRAVACLSCWVRLEAELLAKTEVLGSQAGDLSAAGIEPLAERVGADRVQHPGSGGAARRQRRDHTDHTEHGQPGIICA